MIHLYVTEKALEKLALMARWNKILSCRDVYEVYMDATDEDIARYEYNDGYDFSPISQLISDGSIHPNAAKQRIAEIKSNPCKVLDDPCAVYFLDISVSEAAIIQKQFGVICKNESDIDDTELGDYCEHISVKNEIGTSWYDFLKEIKKSPTNSIVISDRYIFNNDEKSIEGKEDVKNLGMRSVIDILDAILPDSFAKEEDYDILIVFSRIPAQGAKCKIPFHKLAKNLSERIKSLRSYNLKIEILSIPGNSYGYDLTHNRRVVTNYHILRTEHELKAFRANKSLCSQTLNWDALFAKGILDKNSIPCKNFNILLSNLKEINDYGKKNTETSLYEYALDGICARSKTVKDQIVFAELQNRLIQRA